MNTLFIKPSTGVRVLDPRTKQKLAEEGEHKPRETYWLRRLSDGDVVEIEPQPTKREKAKE